MFICPRVSVWLLPEKFPWYLVLVTITKICWEIQIWLKLDKNIENFTWRHNMFHVVGRGIVAQHINRMHCCFHGSAFNIYYIPDSNICTSTIQWEHTVAFPWWWWLCNMSQCYVAQTLAILFSVCFSTVLHTELTDCVYFLLIALLLLKLTFCLGLINVQILSVIQKTIPLIGCNEGRRLSRLWKKSLSPVVKLRPGVIGPGSITDVRWLIFFAGWGFLNNCFGICPKLLMKPMVAFFFRGSSMLIKEQI